MLIIVSQINRAFTPYSICYFIYLVMRSDHLWLKTRFQLFSTKPKWWNQQEGTFPLIIQCTYETSTYSLSVGVSQKKPNWLMRSSKYQGERKRKKHRVTWKYTALFMLPLLAFVISSQAPKAMVWWGKKVKENQNCPS